MIYSDVNYFIENYGDAIPEDKIEQKLKQSSREMDKYLITRPTCMEDLSDFEKEIFNSCCCEMALFLQENGKYINNVVNSLSIAGTSYSFDSATIKQKQIEILHILDITRFMNRCI